LLPWKRVLPTNETDGIRFKIEIKIKLKWNELNWSRMSFSLSDFTKNATASVDGTGGMSINGRQRHLSSDGCGMRQYRPLLSFHSTRNELAPPGPDPPPGMSSEGTTIKRSRPALPSAANFQFSEFFRVEFDDESTDRRICMKFASQREQGLLSRVDKVSFRSSGRKRWNRQIVDEMLRKWTEMDRILK
jgi:hypothetical protein